MIDKIGASIVRTVVPLIVGLFVTAALKVGVHISTGWATGAVTTVVSGGYYGIVRWLEVRYSAKFGWLLGLVGAPKYDASVAAPAPAFVSNVTKNFVVPVASAPAPEVSDPPAIVSSPVPASALIAATPAVQPPVTPSA